MKPYVVFYERDGTHPDGKPTPKTARNRASKKAARRVGKDAAEGGRKE